MDIGFSRRGKVRDASALDQLNYVSLLAELAAAQAETATARAQSRVATPSSVNAAEGMQVFEAGSFHASTAALLRTRKDS